MSGKKKPEVHIVGIEENRSYATFLTLYQGRDMLLKCHSVSCRDRGDIWDTIYEMRTADLILFFVGGKKEFRILNSIAKFLPDKKCLFVCDFFPGRQKAVRGRRNVLMIAQENEAVDVLAELINMMIYDETTMIDYEDIMSVKRGDLRHYVFGDVEEAINHLRKEAIDDNKKVSILFLHGEFDLTDALEIMKVRAEEEHTLLACGYAEEKGIIGILQLTCDRKEPKEEVKIKKPFVDRPFMWCMLGLISVTLIAIILGVKLILIDYDVIRPAGTEVGGVTIQTIKRIDINEFGNEILCQRDIVKLYGEEYRGVSGVVESTFTSERMENELEMLKQFESASSVSKVTIRRIDDRVISLVEEGHYYTGGSGTVAEGYTFSVKEGIVLTIDDVLIEERKEQFYHEIGGLICEEMSEHPDVKEFHIDYERRYREMYEKAGKLPAWVLSEGGITFLTSQGFGPQVVGVIEVTVPYSKVGQYIKEEYR